MLYCIIIIINHGDVLQMLLMGRALTDGRVTARVKYDLTENLTVKANAQVCMLVSV